MSIKVVHLVRQYHPSIGGMEDVVQNIAHHQLQQHGHQPRIVTLNRLFRNSDKVLEAEEEVQGIRVTRLPYSGSTRYPLAPGVLRHISDADVVHVHGVDFFYDYLAVTKPLHRKPLIASTHGGFFHTAFASKLKRVYFNTVTRSTSMAYDRVVGTSENDGEMFSDIMSSSRLSVIENGVNVEKYADRAASSLQPVMIYFGRWSVNKGLLEAIALFRQIVLQFPEWRLIIAGREYDHTKQELLDIVQREGIADHVTIVESPSETELADLIVQASYYICLSRHEGFGIAPIEAMSAGLTPLLSDIPPFRNLVEKSGLGVLFENKDTVACAQQVLQLHNQGEQSYRERRLHTQAFVAQYSWRHIADRYVDIYRDLVGGRAD